MILELFVIGLIAGYLFYEFTGFSPGGIIAPAYVALFIREPGKIGMTVLIALIVYLCIRHLSAWLILYGRRKFMIAILLGFFLKLGVTLLIQPLPSMNLDLQSIGYIIPGLICLLYTSDAADE